VAWEVGKKLGEALISRCLEETGKYPEGVGIIVWGGSTMRTKGDDIADVVPRISGFFRDSFPNLVERIDEAARIVAALNEPPDANILRRNVLRDAEGYMKEGMAGEEAMREATFRVFGCPPGTYGAGVSELGLRTG